VSGPVPDDEVHVWLARASTADGVAFLLNDDELARAARLRVARAREVFVAAHGLLRVVLGRYLDVDPASLAFETDPRGKPHLVGRSPSSLECNLSHSGSLAAVAVSQASRPVGVDVEELRPLHGEEAVARRVLTAEEWDRYAALPVDARGRELLRVWARKEALVKASGEGVRSALNELSSWPGPGAPWAVVDLDVDGYAAAVAAAGRDWKPVVHLP
jgi:4'-phosphopantetheinyl transferase